MICEQKETVISGLRSGHKGKKGYLIPEQRAETIVWLVQQKAWDISELESYLIDQDDVVDLKLFNVPNLKNYDAFSQFI